VQKVRILGEQPSRIFVEFSYQRLATLGVTCAADLRALQRQNTVVGAGSVETAGPRVQLRLDGAVRQSRGHPRRAHRAPGGRTLTLGDVAQVRRGYEDPPAFQIRNDGEPSLLLGVVMQPRHNGLALGEALDAEEERIAKASRSASNCTRSPTRRRTSSTATASSCSSSPSRWAW
jgi:multidrug efflux pump subunit AcrB